MLDHDSPAPRALDLLDVQVWNVYWAQVERRIGSLFARSDARTRAMAYLAGLLSPAERKNSWQLAEISGDPNPYGFQHLLGRADWDPDALRDRVLEDAAVKVHTEGKTIRKVVIAKGPLVSVVVA